MKRMTQWVMTAALSFCGTMMMLTSCTDAIGTADSRWDRYLGMTAAMTQVPVPTAMKSDAFK